MTGVSQGGLRSYGGESAADRDQRRRRQLVDAGLRVFGTSGYRAATVRGLCREARVADRYFYQYFDGIEDLLLAVYGECMERLTTTTVEAVAGLDVDTDVAIVAERGLDAFFSVVEDPHLARVVWLEVLGVSARVEQTYLSAMKQFGALMLDYLRGVGADLSPHDGIDVELLVTAAVGGISHIALTWFLGGYATERPVVVATTTHFLATRAPL
ncbi:TetR/AcrR family transcriptional regulator [Rhodococcus sp. IEGM 1409]|uniref:TetR/AcrR family transcriptional regulator n=1 Tax=Rhodococcus sp. IEGM 1409 TaxID=3047082 RepID=UPI0024B7AA9B|nr:TetR/AcrR family transcriptional regulator [Rhodococcus sp. IEGM 1409]MDI9901486.1 TetR/AcrR family transcriptional regulator [Rhodococcus sp. IEGM 1409]